MDIARRLIGLCKKAVVCGCVYHTFTHYVCDLWQLAESSMEPTLEDGQVVLVCPSGRLNLTRLQRGDVIIARNPTQPQSSICKRIVGLPGDRVPSSYTGPITFVPAGQIWLEGDNSSFSRDSKYYGPIPLGLVQGRVICRIWPIDFHQPSLHSAHR